MKVCIALLVLLLISTVATGQTGPQKLITYTSAEGRYSILLPREPTLSTQDRAAPTGETYPQYLASSQDTENLNGGFLIGYFDYPASKTFSLDAARDGMVNAVKGTLISERAISLGGVAGKEMRISVQLAGSDYIIRARIYDFSRRVFVLQGIFPLADDTTALGQKVTRIFDSFRVETSR